MTIAFCDDNIITERDSSKGGWKDLLNWLIEARKERGMTQLDLATALGMAQSTIACYESGARKPSVSTAKYIASFFEKPWTLFFDEGDDISIAK